MRIQITSSVQLFNSLRTSVDKRISKYSQSYAVFVPCLETGDDSVNEHAHPDLSDRSRPSARTPRQRPVWARCRYVRRGFPVGTSN